MTPEQLKASILKYAMQGKLVEQKPEDGTGEDLFCKMQQVSTPNKNVTPIVEEEIPFDIPSSWKWCKFGELVDCSMGKTPPRAEPVWWQNDIHWVSISDMKDYGHMLQKSTAHLPERPECWHRGLLHSVDKNINNIEEISFQQERCPSTGRE